ncbi:hypothetical protein R1sor_026368 [Riccia sorocarpa]|uniref:Uncharacterized protein n=1 Tax=Riccia sorocarpa TaxID=122646 RepID=A0ABD3GEG5_9MARC
MSALLLVALFFCLPPQVFLFPAAQRCSVILPVLPVSAWPNPFSSVFSYACLVSFYGRAQEGVHKMRANFGVAPIVRSSGRSSQLSNRGLEHFCESTRESVEIHSLAARKAYDLVHGNHLELPIPHIQAVEYLAGYRTWD